MGGDHGLADERFEVPLEKAETPYRGPVWSVQRDTFRYGNETLVREFINHPGAVAVLAIDDRERILLIRQYRHPIGMRIWEIPAGLLDVRGENPLDSAKRELAEEADLEAREWTILSDFVASPGSSDEAIRIFLARDVRGLDTPFSRSAEEADIEIRWVELDDAVDAVLARRLRNPSLVVAVLAANAERSRGWRDRAPVDEAWSHRLASDPTGHGAG